MTEPIRDLCAECGTPLGEGPGQDGPIRGNAVGIGGLIHRRCYFRRHKAMQRQYERRRRDVAPQPSRHRLGCVPREAKPTPTPRLAIDAVERIEAASAASACRQILAATRRVFGGSRKEGSRAGVVQAS